MDHIQQINYLSIFIASLIPFALGGVWYSPMVLGDIWRKEVCTDRLEASQTHSSAVYLISWVLSFITATAFALYLGESPTPEFAVKQGLFIGCFFVATCFGVNYLFTKRSFKLFLIDSLYYITQFVLYGLIISVMHA
ncbi:MAG: hypothetical protein K0Q51_161 [Rickettsiaceae bacterium]|jgi:hypothetical protein|nr:hypothetical protein [Rickettsiaceae bacterium]